MMVRLLLAIGIGEIIVGLLVGFVAGNQDGFLYSPHWVGGLAVSSAVLRLSH